MLGHISLRDELRETVGDEHAVYSLREYLGKRTQAGLMVLDPQRQALFGGTQGVGHGGVEPSWRCGRLMVVEVIRKDEGDEVGD